MRFHALLMIPSFQVLSASSDEEYSEDPESPMRSPRPTQRQPSAMRPVAVIGSATMDDIDAELETSVEGTPDADAAARARSRTERRRGFDGGFDGNKEASMRSSDESASLFTDSDEEDRAKNIKKNANSKSNNKAMKGGSHHIPFNVHCTVFFWAFRNI